MARYVIAVRKAGRALEGGQIRAKSDLAGVLDSLPLNNIVRGFDAKDELASRVIIVDAEAADMEAHRLTLPTDIIVEPEILHWPDVIPPRDFLPVQHGVSMALGAGVTNPLSISVIGGGAPLPNVDLKLHLRGLGGTAMLQSRTDANGVGVFQLPLGHTPAALIVIPTGDFWPIAVRGEAIKDTIECPALPMDGPLGWWHTSVGIDAFDSQRGSGIRVGVIDTGAGPHSSLAHAVVIGAFIDGGFQPNGGVDVGSHGTHVSCTIGARPTGPGHYGGVAPGCELFVARVFRDAVSGASNGDIADAIEALSTTYQVDLINLSLGATEPSLIVRDAIIAAGERGTLCICAAGNDGAAVNFPAAFPEAVAVAAAGLAGWGPSSSLSATRLPIDGTLFGHENLYAANFTSNGPQVLGIGPGVGILAGVPSHFGEPSLHGCMDGTSMASPVVCAALAVLLSQNATYAAMPRQQNRTSAARSILRSALRDIALPQAYQGLGIPSVPTPVV